MNISDNKALHLMQRKTVMKAQRAVVYIMYAFFGCMPLMLAENNPADHRPSSVLCDAYNAPMALLMIDDATEIATAFAKEQDEVRGVGKRKRRKEQKKVLSAISQACLMILEQWFEGQEPVTRGSDFAVASVISRLTAALHVTDEYYRLGRESQRNDQVLYPFYADLIEGFEEIYSSDAQVRTAAIGTTIAQCMALDDIGKERWIEATIDNAREANCLFEVFTSLIPRMPVDITTHALRETTRSLAMNTKAPNTLQRFIYTHPIGRAMRQVFRRSWFTMFAGYYADSRISRRHIADFVKKYEIDMDEADKPIESYGTFNQFFTRKLKKGARPVVADSDVLSAPADGHVLLIDHISEQTIFPVKKHKFTLEKFLGDKKLAAEYEGGTMLIFRLAPWDYHRFHFPADGTPQKWRRIKGAYESVHPIAYASGVQPLQQNERHLVTMHTDAFDDIVVVPVGALCVGKIKETYTANSRYAKGDEMGYFAFGGSTVVMLLKPGIVDVDEHFVQNSRRGTEVPVKMGEAIGRRIRTGS